MPRRNRNAHAPAIDTDELAAQAAQLTAELSGMHIPVFHLANAIQLRLGGSPQAGKSSVLIGHSNEWIKEHPGCTVGLLDVKQSFTKVVTGHDR